MPTLTGLVDWFKTEAGNAITVVLVGLAVRFFLKQQIGKMIGLIVLASAVLLVIGNPDSIIKAVQAIFSKVVKGA